MTNYEHIKELDIEQLGHFLCDSMDDLGSDYPCDHCPMNYKCVDGVNGWFAWMSEEKK